MITMIYGVPGAGKTSLMAYYATQILQNDLENYISCKRELRGLNNTGFNYGLPPQKHVCYSDNTIRWGKRRNSYYVDGFRIGLPNMFFDTCFLPPYATIFLDEAQRYYDSRMSKFLREDVYHWYQLHRHNDYNVYLVCQRPANIDVNIRALAERVIVLDSCVTQLDDYGSISQITWRGRTFASADTAENYLLASDKSQFASLGQDFTQTCDYDIFACYNSKSCRPAFYADYNKPIEFYTANGCVATLQSYVEYNNSHYFTAPQGFWKNTERDKKILAEKEAIYGN